MYGFHVISVKNVHRLLYTCLNVSSQLQLYERAVSIVQIAAFIRLYKWNKSQIIKNYK